MDLYKLDEKKNPVKCAPGEIPDFFDKSKRVDQTEIGDYWVSTVFLGMDHGHPQWSGHTENYKPVLFETMIQNMKTHEWLDYQERYHTYKEALEGHKKAIQWVKDGCNKDE